MRKILMILASAIGFAVLAPVCRDKRVHIPTNPSPEENRMVLHSQDTTIVLGLVSDFMERIVARDPAGAAALLYTVDYSDPTGEPYPVTMEQEEELAPMLNTPVTDYEIANYIFDTPDSNEVRCLITINGRIRACWYFKPVRFLGDWYLCLKDSAEGDRPLHTKGATIVR